jgi:hypothetical protein
LLAKPGERARLFCYEAWWQKNTAVVFLSYIGFEGEMTKPEKETQKYRAISEDSAYRLSF